MKILYKLFFTDHIVIDLIMLAITPPAVIALLLTAMFMLVGCVEVPNEVKVQHTTSLDQCADHGGRYSLDVLKNQLICNDGAEFSLFKGE